MNQLLPLVPAAPFLKRASRGMHRRICGAPGAGKTRLTARLLLPYDLFFKDDHAKPGDGLPILAIDPRGALTNDFLDVIDRLPPRLRRLVVERIRYINMAGMTLDEETYVHAFPFLTRIGDESLYTIAQRYIAVVVRTWPSLQKSPILGEAAVANIAENVLIALLAMDCQITEAEDLLRRTESWVPRLREARARAPEAAPAIDWLLTDYLAELTSSEKRRETLSFFRRISMFRLDQVLRAQYGASVPSLTPAQLAEEQRCVILDFRDVLNEEQKKLGILWMFHYFNDYFKVRGPGGRDNPIALYIDELQYLLPAGKKRNELIAGDIADLLTMTSRNNGIFVTLIHQDIGQFDEDTNTLLARLGTQIIGSQHDTAYAEAFAKRFFRYDKLKAKAWQNVWASEGGRDGGHFVIDQRPVYETAQEQVIENSYKFLDLATFHFLVGVAKREGQLPTRLTEVSFADFDEGNFARVEQIDQLRGLLMARSGRQMSQILADIETRRPGEEPDGPFRPTSPQPPSPAPPSGTVRIPKTSRTFRGGSPPHAN